MNTFKSFDEVLYGLNEGNFDDIALRVFNHQKDNNPIYGDFVSQLKRGPVNSVQSIPFLPIRFFKDKNVSTGSWSPEVTFTSSGTTGLTTSQHPVLSMAAYLRNAERIFTQFYGPLTDYHFLALLPSYLEREGSSLVAMANDFITKTGSPYSGFYLTNQADLEVKLKELASSTRKVILLGVTFALLDLAERHPMDLSHCVIMETGGMKGRRREMIRDEVHQYLCRQFNVGTIHSEYGMTELLSQAYSAGSGRFIAPPVMKVIVRDITDPFGTEIAERTGAINVIDLANLHSCAFIETEDLGRIHEDGSFEVLGRLDNSDIRGCNLLV